MPDLSRFIHDKEGGSFGGSQPDQDLDDLAKTLLKCQSTGLIDERAKELLKSSNGALNKTTRKQVVKILFNVPRNSLTLIPYYARFAAIVN